MTSPPASDGAIAADVSPQVRPLLIAMMVEAEGVQAPLAVSEGAIRHWCETVEDGNRLYLDDAYARTQGYSGAVAPPVSLLSTFVMPFRWPWPPAEGEPPRGIHDRLKQLLGCPIGVQTESDVRFYREMTVNERAVVSERLVSVSARKVTKLGEGRFWQIDTIVRNQIGELVARDRKTLFGYGSTASAETSA